MNPSNKALWWAFAVSVAITSLLVILWMPQTKQILTKLTDLLILLFIVTVFFVSALTIAVRTMDRLKSGNRYITVNREMTNEQALLYVYKKHPTAQLEQVSCAEKTTTFLLIISVNDKSTVVRYAFENVNEPFQVHLGGILLADHPTLNILLRKQAIDAILKDLT